MAKMTAAQRQQAHARHMRESDFNAVGALKSEWRQLVDAADNFVDDNRVTYNTTIPIAIRSKFTPRQKALALVLVIARRFIIGLEN